MNIKNLFIRRVNDNCYYSGWFVHCYYDYATRQRVVALIGLNVIIAIVWAIQDKWFEILRQPSWIDREIEKRFEVVKEQFRDFQQREWVKQFDAIHKQDDATHEHEKDSQ